MNIVIVGLGAIGGVYATAFHHHSIPFKVALDSDRMVRYGSQPFIFNDREYCFDYFTPSPDDKFTADLIIIATKWDGYSDALEMVRPIVGKNTAILPLLNGISSERVAIEKFGEERVIYGYFLGHTSTRSEGMVSHDGRFVTIFGREHNNPTELDPKVRDIATLMDKANIKYRIDPDMIASLWQKFVINVGLNQSTAFFDNNYGEIKSDTKKMDFTKALMQEAVQIAQYAKIKGWESLLEKGLETLEKMRDEDSSSMRQDVLASRVTEVDLFAGEVSRMGQRYNISTPCNNKVLAHFTVQKQ